MVVLEIKVLPDSILRKKAREVANAGDSERETLTQMAEAMYLNHGVGLAALQVGIDKRLAVVDVGNGLIKMVNPAIMKKDGTESQEEGCLSVPGACVKIKRAKNIKVGFLNEHGKAIQLEAQGLLARAIQHEIDHLDGKLIIDYLNPLKRLMIKAQLSRKLNKLGLEHSSMHLVDRLIELTWPLVELAALGRLTY